MTWQTIDTAPDDETPILIAMPLVASECHPEKPKGELLYWKCACVSGEDVRDDIYLDDAGYSASEFSHWKPVGEFPEIIE